jgi:uncharacterized membrane protein YoaK (UPF0700 family)
MTVIVMVLTFASGASDVTSITRLGNAFTSVMTGNIAIFGLSLARESVSQATHTATAVAGYTAGVAIGTQLSWHAAKRWPAEPAEEPHGEHWPPYMPLLLGTELLLLSGVLAGWEITGSRPAGGAQFVILAVAACAMGIQSAAVNQLRLGNVSTTYLTGTLTGLVSAAFRPGSTPGWRRPLVVAGLLAGAVLAGVLLASAPAVVPVLPLLGVATATLLGSIRRSPRGWRADELGGDDAVADAADGFDPGAGAGELGAQPRQVHVDRVRGERVGLVAPHVLRDLAAIRDGRREPHQRLQDAQLRDGQRRPAVADPDLARGRVALQVRDDEPRREQVRRAALQRAQPGEQFGEVERLADVIVGARVQASHPVLRRVLAADHQNRRGQAPAAQLAHQLDAGVPGHV